MALPRQGMSRGPLGPRAYDTVFHVNVRRYFANRIPRIDKQLFPFDPRMESVPE